MPSSKLSFLSLIIHHTVQVIAKSVILVSLNQSIKVTVKIITSRSFPVLTLHHVALVLWLGICLLALPRLINATEIWFDGIIVGVVEFSHF